MAKQHTLVNLTGKIGESSYYYTRNGGFQIRRINPNMSERVKTEPGFQNTRLNANEFGAAGSTVIPLMSYIHNHYSWALKPGANGRMVKKTRVLIQSDVLHPFGRRSLPQTTFELYMNEFNRQQRRQIPQYITQFMEENMYWDVENQKLSCGQKFTVSQPMLDMIKMGKVYGVEFRVFTLSNVVSFFSQASAGYTSGAAIRSTGMYFEGGVNIYSSEGETIWPAVSLNVSPKPVFSDNLIGGILVVMLPYKWVNDQEYYLDKQSALRWMKIKTV